MTEAGGPLAGVLVADFSRVLAGPYATMLLADLGADVIKVESPAGDDTRGWQPPARGEESTYFLAVNRNKRSVILDLRETADVALARELARRADVVIENFRPGQTARWGLDHASVAADNPGVVYASISGFGCGEQGAAMPGYDLLAQAVSGLMSVTGAADGPPTKAGVAVVDVITGLHAALGILAALRHRDRTGRGQRIEVDLLTSALSGLVNQSGAVVAGGVTPTRLGNGHPSLYPYDPFPCADRDVIIAVGNDTQFRSLTSVLGVAELADDPRFARNRDRVEHREALRPLLEERTRPLDSGTLGARLTAAGVACGPINTVAEGLALAAGLGLNPVALAGEGDDAVPTVRHPVTLSATPARHDRRPPRLGEHDAEIRAWLRADRTDGTGDHPTVR